MSRTTLLRLAGLLGLVAAATGCYPWWMGAELDRKVLASENASKETRAKQDELRRDFDGKFDERLARIDKSMEAFEKSASITTADVSSRVDELLTQVQGLRGVIEQAGFANEDLKRRLDELDSKLVALGGDKAIEKAAAKKALAEVERPADKKAFFALAKGYHAKKEWSFARPLLAEFTQKWKFDELSPEAQLLIGDSWFAEKQWRAAILEYQKIRETWPKSKQLPDSLYKLGVCFLELGLKDEARLFLEEAAKFTAQQAGKDARSKLKDLGGGKPPPPKKP